MVFRYGLILCLSLCSLAPVLAKDFGRLYDEQILRRAADVYGPNLQGLFREDFLSRLTLQERRAAPRIHLATPLVGANRSPWDYYALIDRQRIVVPILSVKFLDDLSISYAYMDRFGCDREMLFNYLTKLLYDEDYPPTPPRAALGIPSDALDDAFVDDVSQKLLKSSIFFLIGHEYGHVMHRHRGYGQISSAEAQRQENQSDDFALGVMRRIGVAPMGLAFFFAMASRIEPVPAAFDSQADFDRHIRETLTHPLTGSRLRNVADYMRESAVAFARLQPDPQAYVRAIASTAGDIEKIGDTIHDGQFRQFQLQRGLATSGRQLRAACD